MSADTEVPQPPDDPRRESNQETRRAREEKPSADFVQGTLTAIVAWLPELPRTVKVIGASAFLYLVFCLVGQIPPREAPSAVVEIVKGYLAALTLSDAAQVQAGKALAATEALKAETHELSAAHEQRIVGVESDVAALKRRQAALAAEQARLKEQPSTRPPSK